MDSRRGRDKMCGVQLWSLSPPLIFCLIFATAILAKDPDRARSPNIVDIGYMKPISASMEAKATCGKDGIATEYCVPPDDAEGFLDGQCNNQYCMHECNGRDKNEQEAT